MPRGRPRTPGIFTPREWQVLFLLRHELTNAEIARELGLSLAGAKFHVAEILSRLGVESRKEAAAWRTDATQSEETQKVNFQRITPMIRTNDFEETLDFYTNRLDFSVESVSEQDGWASIARDAVRLMIAKPNDHFPFQAPSFTGSFYFYVDDVASLWRDLKDTQEVLYPMEDFEYGMREFAIYDNNGYLLQFGQPLPE